MESEILPLVDFSKVKKKKRVGKEIKLSDKAKESKNNEENKSSDKNNAVEEEKEKETTYTLKEEYAYDFLLERVYGMIKSQNPDLSIGKSNLKIPAPNIAQMGSRSVWTNFGAFITALNRPQEHLFNFMKAELGCEATVGGEKQLFLKSKKITKDQIEKALKKYAQEYIKCPNCKSYKTILRKDPSTRLQQIVCESCKSEKTIQVVKSTMKAGKK